MNATPQRVSPAYGPDHDPANIYQPSSNLFVAGSLLHPRYNLECTFVRRATLGRHEQIPSPINSTLPPDQRFQFLLPALLLLRVRATHSWQRLWGVRLPLPLRQYRGAETIHKFSDPTAELAALLTSTADLYDLGWRRFIRCTGVKTGVRWLNGMVTNFVSNLDENAGCYAFVLNSQGRIQGDLDIYRRADSLWLETDASQVEALTAFLDH